MAASIPGRNRQRRVTGNVTAARRAARRPRRWRTIASLVLLAVSTPLSAFALDLLPIATTGFDQDIVFEAGLTAGQVGASGELGSRQFFEQGVFADGVPRSIVDFTSTITGDVIDFNFAPFENNNVLKFDTTQATSKTLTLTAPSHYGQLAIVHSSGSLGINSTTFAPTEIALVSYTINYVGGSMQTGTFNSVDWGRIDPPNMPQGTEILLNADRSTTNATMWPVNTDNNTTPNRWSLYLTEITPNQPAVNIESITFGPISLNTEGTSLNGGDDVVIFGLAGSVEARVLGDTDGDGTGGEYPDDFNPIKDNFRKAVTLKTQGDLVKNGVVDFADFREWKAAAMASGTNLQDIDFGSIFGAVPEPSAVMLALLGLVGLTAWRGKR